MSNAKNIEELELDGGVACLDLVNTAVDVDPDVLVERLHNYNDLLTLTRRTGLLDNTTIKSLREMSTDDPDGASSVMDKMRQVRRDLYAIFLAVSTGRVKQLDAALLARFNKAVAWAGDARKFRVSKQAIASDWDVDVAGLSLPLRAFVASAGELLLQQDHSLIKKCEGCAWLFFDSSKNHRRKWCDMQSCGSVSKSRRYYKKKTGSD